MPIVSKMEVPDVMKAQMAHTRPALATEKIQVKIIPKKPAAALTEVCVRMMCCGHVLCFSVLWMKAKQAHTQPALATEKIQVKIIPKKPAAALTEVCACGWCCVLRACVYVP